MTTLPLTLEFTEADQAVRARLRAYIAEHGPGTPSADFPTRVEQLRSWQRDLHDAGFTGLSWPVADGGQAMSLSAEAVLCEELGHCSMPELINRIALYTVAPMIQAWGTADQRRRLLPGMLDAAEIWCQGFSEPGAGSDLAGIRTRGVRDGDGWLVSGQKVWTSRAMWSKWCALLIRTSGVPGEHSGLTLVALDMDSEGVNARPLYQVLHEAHFSEVFLDNVRVPDENVIGGAGNGWKVAMSTMGFERGLFVLERQIGLRRRLEQFAAGLHGDVDRQERVGHLTAMLDVLRAHTYRTLAEQEQSVLKPGATSVDKLFLTECYQSLCAEIYDALSGAEALLMGDEAHDLLESRSVSIYSGTSEIQRNIVAAQLLKLTSARAT